MKTIILLAVAAVVGLVAYKTRKPRKNLQEAREQMVKDLAEMAKTCDRDVLRGYETMETHRINMKFNEEMAMVFGLDESKVKEYEELLNLDAGYEVRDVTLAKRRMLRKNHPDRGGDTALSARITNAAEYIEHRLSVREGIVINKEMCFA